MASGEASCRRIARAAAQGGTAARARHQLLTWRVVVAGEASEDGLADVSAGQQGGEFGA